MRRGGRGSCTRGQLLLGTAALSLGRGASDIITNLVCVLLQPSVLQAVMISMDIATSPMNACKYTLITNYSRIL